MDLNELAKALGPRSSEMVVTISFPRSWETFPQRRIQLTVNGQDHVLTMQQYAEVLKAAMEL